MQSSRSGQQMQICNFLTCNLTEQEDVRRQLTFLFIGRIHTKSGRQSSIHLSCRESCKESICTAVFLNINDNVKQDASHFLLDYQIAI